MSDVQRRSFLKYVAAEAALLAGKPVSGAAGSPYRVGVGRSDQPYNATLAAVGASGEFPAPLLGRTVVIKPNLVVAMPATSGVTTSPDVVRALVDLALAAGAAKVIIGESSAGTPVPFTECGYDIFNHYDPRVQLMDFTAQPVTLAAVQHGYVYRGLYLPAVLADPNVILMSAAKLKTHLMAGATLSVKNLVALPPYSIYGSPGSLMPRADLHDRGLDLSIVDIHLARRTQFAVIDGIWGMQGQGPVSGTPVNSRVVLAGLNPVAVDLIGLQAMQIDPGAVPHLYYAGAKALGPLDASSVTVAGDPLPCGAYLPAQTGPGLALPVAIPATLSLSAGGVVNLYCRFKAACEGRAEILLDRDVKPCAAVLRVLHDWTPLPAGTDRVLWNGRDTDGNPVSPGVYLGRFVARWNADSTITNMSVPITVNA